jgi:uncharacterized membrane protein
MTKTIEDYLRQLKAELAGSDRATIQDALSDAEEYLRNARAGLNENNSGLSEEDAMIRIVSGYGTPEEVAAAYKQIEVNTTPYKEGHIRPIPDQIAPSVPEKRSFVSCFLGVVIEPRAWGSLFYLLFSLATGIFYFTWTVTGLSVSLGLLILVIGIILAGLFLFSLRGFALLEGRLVEALLGVRMPRRAPFSAKNAGLWNRFKNIVTDRYTWFSMIYFIILLPLGIFYFTLFVSFIATSLYLLIRPILELVFNLPLFTSYDIGYYTPVGLMPLMVIGGALLFILTLHLAKIIGNMHGSLAKAMLVR